METIRNVPHDILDPSQNFTRGDKWAAGITAFSSMALAFSFDYKRNNYTFINDIWKEGMLNLEAINKMENFKDDIENSTK